MNPFIPVQANSEEESQTNYIKTTFSPLPPLAPVKAGSNSHGKEKIPQPTSVDGRYSQTKALLWLVASI
jgi:hypothetical protein